MEHEMMWQWSMKGCGNGAGKDGQWSRKGWAMEHERMWQWNMQGLGNGAGKDGAMEQERMWQWSRKSMKHARVFQCYI
jgi:hypothetical protein